MPTVLYLFTVVILIGDVDCNLFTGDDIWYPVDAVLFWVVAYLLITVRDMFFVDSILCSGDGDCYFVDDVLCSGDGVLWPTICQRFAVIY